MMLKELRKAGRYQFSREDYLREEGPTFNALSWNMMCVTPYHFYQSLASMGLLYEDDRMQAAKAKSPRDGNSEKLAECIRLSA